MAIYVLVHGMWHGGWCWKKVRPLLQAAGHEVFTPTLTGVGERAHLRDLEIDLNTHVQDIVNVLEYEDLRGVQLCGHSLAVGLVMAVAEHTAERLGHLIGLDGPLPGDGQAFKDVFPDHYTRFRQLALSGGDGEWVSAPPDWTFGVTDEADLQWLRSKMTAYPMKTWETPFSFQNPKARSLPRTFISCTGDRTSEEVAAEKKEWTDKGWQYRALATGHDAMITEPQKLTDILIGLA